MRAKLSISKLRKSHVMNYYSINVNYDHSPTFLIQLRKGTGKATATIILVLFSVFFYGALQIWGSFGSSSNSNYYRLGLAAAFQVSPVSVENARWQIVLIVENLGTADTLVDTIYVNNDPVTIQGLIHGDTLNSTLDIGTSVPYEGVIIPGGKSATFYVWIGADKFTSGTSIEVEVQKSALELRKTVKLN